MPQLDITIIFSQIFWFFLFFIIFYSLLIHIILPKLVVIFKTRKLITINNIEEAFKIKKNSTRKINIVTQWISKSLLLINKTLKVKSSYLNKVNTNDQLDLKISLKIKELMLYYNRYIFNTINLYHKNFNYKK